MDFAKVWIRWVFQENLTCLQTPNKCLEKILNNNMSLWSLKTKVCLQSLTKAWFTQPKLTSQPKCNTLPKSIIQANFTSLARVNLMNKKNLKTILIQILSTMRPKIKNLTSNRMMLPLVYQQMIKNKHKKST